MDRRVFLHAAGSVVAAMPWAGGHRQPSTHCRATRFFRYYVANTPTNVSYQIRKGVSLCLIFGRDLESPARVGALI